MLLGFDRKEAAESMTAETKTVTLDGRKIRRTFECSECGNVTWHYAHFSENPIIKECKPCEKNTQQSVCYPKPIAKGGGLYEFG